MSKIRIYWYPLFMMMYGLYVGLPFLARERKKLWLQILPILYVE